MYVIWQFFECLNVNLLRYADNSERVVYTSLTR